MARHQVHRSRWIACRRRSAAPSITILVFSRGKTVEKCAVGRPPGFLLTPQVFSDSHDRSILDLRIAICHTCSDRSILDLRMACGTQRVLVDLLNAALCPERV